MFVSLRHNEDGSYTYGYESSDGSFKLETRYPDGLVQGKYGYIDIDTGELKVIEYGADMMGFQPQARTKQFALVGKSEEVLGSAQTGGNTHSFVLYSTTRYRVAQIPGKWIAWKRSTHV